MKKHVFSDQMLRNLEMPAECSRIIVTHNNNRVVIRNAKVATTSIESKQALLITRLMEFYEVPAHFEALLPILTQNAQVSLRLYDWLVTNYAKKANVFIPVTRSGVTENINLFLDYKAHLKSYSKRSFDPFCRRERIVVQFPCDPEKRRFVTTAAQLNFFRWAIGDRRHADDKGSSVVEYCEAHAKEIEEDMVSNLRVRVVPGGRRTEISKSATSILSRSNVDRVIEL